MANKYLSYAGLQKFFNKIKAAFVRVNEDIEISKTIKRTYGDDSPIVNPNQLNPTITVTTTLSTKVSAAGVEVKRDTTDLIGNATLTLSPDEVKIVTESGLNKTTTHKLSEKANQSEVDGLDERIVDNEMIEIDICFYRKIDEARQFIVVKNIDFEKPITDLKIVVERYSRVKYRANEGKGHELDSSGRFNLHRWHKIYEYGESVVNADWQTNPIYRIGYNEYALYEFDFKIEDIATSLYNALNMDIPMCHSGNFKNMVVGKKWCVYLEDPRTGRMVSNRALFTARKNKNTGKNYPSLIGTMGGVNYEKYIG